MPSAPQCHPDRKLAASGLCWSCYMKVRAHTGMLKTLVHEIASNDPSRAEEIADLITTRRAIKQGLIPSQG